MRVLRGRPFTVDAIFVDAAGEPVDVDDDVKVTVTRDSDGGTLVDSTVAQPGGGTGRFAITVSPVDQVDRLVVVFVGDVAGDTQTVRGEVDVAGGFYTSVSNLKTLDGLSSAPDVKLAGYRDAVEDRIELAIHRHWVPRYRRDDVRGTGTSRLRLPRPARSILAVDGDDLEPDDLTIAGSTLTRARGRWERGQVYSIAYESGEPAPPAALRQAAIDAIAYLVKGDSSTVSPRATSIDNEFGSYRIAVPDDDRRPFGFPDVDAVVARYAGTSPGRVVIA